MNKKNKTENSYVNLFKLKKIENVDKNTTTENKRGINFANLTDWDDINYLGNKQSDGNKFDTCGGGLTSENFIKKNSDYKIEHSKQDREYNFNRDVIELQNDNTNYQEKIIKISYNPHTQQPQNVKNTNLKSMTSTNPIVENQKDDFSVNTSNFTNNIGDNALNQLDRIELSQNNFPFDFNGIQTNISNKKILPFNSTENIGNVYKNFQGYDCEIIEEKDDEEGKLNPSEYNFEPNKPNARQENITTKIKNLKDDSDTDYSNFSLSVNQELNVTSNQLEDMNRELKNINYNLKLTERKNKKKLHLENSNDIGKIILDPIKKKKKENLSKIEVFEVKNDHQHNTNNQNYQIEKDSKNFKLKKFNTNSTNEINDKQISIQTYQNNSNVMPIQPPPYYNSNINTINQMNFNHINNQIQIDANAGFPMNIPIQMPYNDFSYNQIQQIYPQTNFYLNPYVNNFGTFPFNMPNYNMMNYDHNKIPSNQIDFNQINNLNVNTNIQSPVTSGYVENFRNKNEINSIKTTNKSSNYKPYSYLDYKLKYEDKNVKLGGLGANIGTKEWEEKFQKKKKMKEYSSNFNAICNTGKDNSNEKEIEKDKINNLTQKSNTQNAIQPDSPLSNKIESKTIIDDKSLNDSSINLEQRIFRDLKIANNLNDVITYSISSSDSKEKNKKTSNSHVHNLKKLKEDKKSQNENQIKVNDNKIQVRAKSSIKKEKEENLRPIRNIYTTIHTEKENLKKNKNKKESNTTNFDLNTKTDSIRKSRPASSKVLITNKNEAIDEDPYLKNFYNKKIDEYDHLETLLKQHKDYHQKVQNIKSFITKLN